MRRSPAQADDDAAGKVHVVEPALQAPVARWTVGRRLPIGGLVGELDEPGPRGFRRGPFRLQPLPFALLRSVVVGDFGHRRRIATLAGARDQVGDIGGMIDIGLGAFALGV